MSPLDDVALALAVTGESAHVAGRVTLVHPDLPVMAGRPTLAIWREGDVWRGHVLGSEVAAHTIASALYALARSCALRSSRAKGRDVARWRSLQVILEILSERHTPTQATRKK